MKKECEGNNGLRLGPTVGGGLLVGGDTATRFPVWGNPARFCTLKCSWCEFNLGFPGPRMDQITSQRIGHTHKLTSVMMSLAKSLARSGVTKQDRPVSATPVSYWLGLLRSWKGREKSQQTGADRSSPAPAWGLGLGLREDQQAAASSRENRPSPARHEAPSECGPQSRPRPACQLSRRPPA